jgi:hypothetical protein
VIALSLKPPHADHFPMRAFLLLYHLHKVSASVCPAEVVESLTTQLLFDRLSLCATDAFYVNVETCVSQLPGLIRMNLEELTPACMSCVATFVNSVAASQSTLRDACSTYPRSPACLELPGMRTALAGFQTCSETSLVYPSCTAREARRFAQGGTTRSVIEIIGQGASDFSSIGIPYTTCGLCYYQLGAQLSTAAQQNATVMTAIQNCRTSPTLTEACRASIREFLDMFASCSGVEAGRYGPECTPTELEAINLLEPYRVLTSCAYTPEDPSCESIDRFFATCESVANSACVTCYREYLGDVKSFRATVSAGSACSNINSQNCLTWNAQQIQNLAKCTSGG